MDIAIVLLNYKSRDLTVSLINKLNQFGYTTSIFVVDNGSTDGSIEAFQELEEQGRITFIQNNENAGYAKGNNLGLRAALNTGYQYALVMNSDIEIASKEDIESMRDTIKKHEKVACVCPRIVNPDGKEVAQRLYRPSAFDWTIGIFTHEKKLRKETEKIKGDTQIYRPHGCCMMFRLNMLSDVGFLCEETFLYFEEAIVAEKLLEKGYLVYCDGNVRVLHNHSVVTKKTLKKLEMIKIYNRSAEIYLKEFRRFGVVKRKACVFVKGLSMLKGWM